MRNVACWLFILIAVTAVGRAPLAAESADYRRLNQAIVTQHILPRYQQFATATDKLAAAADQACATRRTVDLGALRETFAAAMDAWQSVQHIRFGPVEFFSRGSRISFWPDPRNTVGRQLGELLAKHDEHLLASDAFAKGSVAVQGFPALEMLIYGDDAAANLRADTADAAFRCAVIKAIAHNLRTMAHDIEAEWTGGDDPYAALLDRADDVRFRKQSEVTVELFKALYTAVELVADHKLARPMGDAVQSARPRLAESWRSKRSMENIRRNLGAAQALYEGEISAFVRDVAHDEALDALFRRAFAQTLATAAGITVPLEDGVGKAPTRAPLEKLSRETRALKALLVQRLAPALGVPVGFNQLDGD